MLVETENMNSLLPGSPWIWITMEIYMDGYRIFVISMNMVDIHPKVDYFKQVSPAIPFC